LTREEFKKYIKDDEIKKLFDEKTKEYAEQDDVHLNFKQIKKYLKNKGYENIDEKIIIEVLQAKHNVCLEQKLNNLTVKQAKDKYNDIKLYEILKQTLNKK